MAEREKNEQLQKLLDEGKNVYSHSKLSSIDNCLYGAYLTYIKGEKGTNNIYALAGGKIHDVLQGICEGYKTEADLLPTLEEELSDYSMLGISFPKDKNGEDSIMRNWVANMTHFCNNFKKPNGEFITEEFLLLKIDDTHFLQGYCDLIRVIDKEKKIVSVYDWKTSSQFSTEDLIHHGHQLIIYKLALEQLGYTVKECAWIMLKYCTIKYRGFKTARSKEESDIEKNCERRKIVETIKDNLEYRLTQANYDEVDIEIMLHEALEKNSLDSIPEEIRNQYKILPYVRKYDITEELEQECIDFIKEISGKWEALDEREISYPPRKFTKVNKSGKETEDIFFCLNLCQHKKSCPHIQQYLDTKDNKDNEYDDLF